MELLTEKEDLINTINNLNSIVSTITTRAKEREDSLNQEIEILRGFAAEHSDEKFDALEEENRHLRQELKAQREKFDEMENQYKQENQDLMHLYIDAEETKKHILEQLTQLKQTKDRLQQDKRLVEASKSEILKTLDVNAPQVPSIFQRFPSNSHNPEDDLRMLKRPTATFTEPHESNQADSIKDYQLANRPPTLDPLAPNPIESQPHDKEENDFFAQLINQRLQQQNQGGSQNPSVNISREEEANIFQIRQMIAHMQANEK